MPYEFKLPDLGEGLTEGEIARWLVREGQEIAEDDPLVEIATDKTTVEIPSPAAGIVTTILVAEGEVVPGQKVVRTRTNPIYGSGGLAILRGNLAPGGAVIKQSSATPSLLQHTGRAIVFDSLDDLAARIDATDLDVSADDVLVLRNAGPRGAPGMPEAGYIPIPKKLAQQGVKDMVRISDARMSGTAFGSIVLHITPEAAIGGPLAWVRTGDSIRLDVERRAIELLVTPEELSRRATAGLPPLPEIPSSGYRRLYLEHVTQADRGCDFDFMLPAAVAGFAPVDV